MQCGLIRGTSRCLIIKINKNNPYYSSLHYKKGNILILSLFWTIYNFLWDANEKLPVTGEFLQWAHCQRENRRWGSEDGKHETVLSRSFTLTEIEKWSTNWKNVRSSQKIFWVGLLKWEICSLCYGIYPVWRTIQCSRGRGYLLKGLSLSSSSRGDETQDWSRRWV